MWVSSSSDDLHRCASPRWGSIRRDTRTGSCRRCWHSFPPDTGRAAPGIRLCLMRDRERERVITANPPRLHLAARGPIHTYPPGWPWWGSAGSLLLQDTGFCTRLRGDRIHQGVCSCLLTAQRLCLGFSTVMCF